MKAPKAAPSRTASKAAPVVADKKAKSAKELPVTSKAKAAPAPLPPAKAQAAKAAAKPSAKPGVKPSAKPAAVAKPAAKPVAQPAKAAPKAAAAPKAPVQRSSKKSESVPTTISAVPGKTTKAVAKPQARPDAKPAEKPAVKAEAKPAAKPASSETVHADTGIPVRSGRPSSRLALLTVPSIAPSVASTAAKASFTQLNPVQAITPQPAAAIKKDRKLANNWKSKPVAELSDEEVIAMPDEEYMNDTQMAFFRLKLVALKNGILSNAGQTTENLRTDTVVVPDPADRATIEEEHALELRTRDRERKLLKKIEQSIARIDAGDYGYCDETGEPIGVGRLLARPTATLSLEAQQRRELKQKMFGD